MAPPITCGIGNVHPADRPEERRWRWRRISPRGIWQRFVWLTVAAGQRTQATDEPVSTAGPMRADLRLMMRALSTFWVEPPRIPDFSRYQAKANYRVCTWFSAPHHEIDQQIAQRFQSFIDKLRAQPAWRLMMLCPPISIPTHCLI